MPDDDNVIITRRKYPPPPPPIVHEKPVVYPMRQEFLSNQAIDYLKKAGYSSSFVGQLGIFLNEAANTNRSTFDGLLLRSKGSIQMPTKLAGFTDYDGERKDIMPAIFTYAPNTRTGKSVVDAFASREGQRFMRKEYHWLELNEKTQEWDIVRPKPSEIVPRRTG